MFFIVILRQSTLSVHSYFAQLAVNLSGVLVHDTGKLLLS